MRRLPLLLVAAAVLAAPAAASAAKPNLYVALGDSYATGHQPTGANGTGQSTRQGIPNHLAKLARARGYGGLKLVNLGCGGTTTPSMIDGSRPCLKAVSGRSYNRSMPQLRYAERYLRRNRGKVAFVTVVLGGNDFASCAGGGNVDVDCVFRGIETMKKNLPVIVRRLRKAAGPKVRIIGHTYPDVVLGLYTTGTKEGRDYAALSVDVFRDNINPAMKSAYTRYKARFVDVTKAFGAYIPWDQTTTLEPYGVIPVAVANICRLTWYCDKRDIHARSSGYAQIAKLLMREVPKRRR